MSEPIQSGDDFINMARQVGMIHTPIGEIKALCRLVAAAEREACAKVVEVAEMYGGDFLKNSDPRKTCAAAIRAMSNT